MNKYDAMADHIEAARIHLSEVVDIQTGRDTNPLYDESATPMDLHIASTIQTLLAQVHWLKMTVDQYGLTYEEDYDERG